MIQPSYFLPVLLLMLLLGGCENIDIVKRTGVSVDTNAYYTAYQKAPTDAWQQINFDNKIYTGKTLSFAMNEPTDSYGVVFVCPSKRRDLPHDIYVFYATAAEMTLLDFKCRKAQDEIVTRALYGKISGVNLATSANSDGELVHIALSSTVSSNVLEAYAEQVPTGRRDAVAYKGKHSLAGNFIEKPEAFLITRNIGSSTSVDSEKINLGFDSGSSYSANFNFAHESPVTISGKNDTDNMSASVSFLSQNKSLLKLFETTQTSFSFVPIPLDAFTSKVEGFFNQNEFIPGEGHELNATVYSADGKIDREVRKFFTLSNAQPHNINLPKAIDFPVSLTPKSTGKYQFIDSTWSEYNDVGSGKTQLYRWVIDGSAADLPADKKPDVEVTKVRWNVHVTPGWISNLSRTSGSFSLTLPVNFESSAQKRGVSVDVWSDDWSFETGTSLEWEFTAFATSDKGSSGAVIEYLLNRNIVENYTFTRASMRSSFVATP